MRAETRMTFMLSKELNMMVMPKMMKKKVRTIKAVSPVTMCNS